ncbi:helix-turn-helix domain-containing protein, partial [Cronobacter sakazakii]
MNILQLDMNLLKVLYVMLQTGTTGETAQRLNITPSAVSHALSRLREALGDPLFRREGNRQHPTPFAQALRDKLVPLFVSLNEEMFGEPQPHERRFRVVVPPALNTLLAPVLAQKAHQA